MQLHLAIYNLHPIKSNYMYIKSYLVTPNKVYLYIQIIACTNTEHTLTYFITCNNTEPKFYGSPSMMFLKVFNEERFIDLWL